MKIKCEKCGRNMGERPPYGGHEGKFDTVEIWGVCPECQKKYFESPSQEKKVRK